MDPELVPPPVEPPHQDQLSYQLLFHAYPLPMWVYDLETLRFLDVNEVACRKYGYTRDEFLAMTIRDLRPREDVAAVEASVRAMPSQSFSAGIWRHRLKDGRQIFVEVTSHKICYRGRRARFVCPLDVTPRLLAEQALQEREAGLRRAQAMARMGHVITLPDGRFESWSENLPSLIGIAAQDMPQTTSEWLQHVHADDRELVRTLSIEAVRDNRRVDMEYRLAHADGHWVSVSHVSEPLEPRTPGGTPRWFSTLQDVTEQHRARERINRLNDVHAALSGISALIVRVSDRAELFDEACRIAAGAGAFHRAWIGMIDPASGEGTVVAWGGGNPQTVRKVDFTARADSPFAGRPASTAVRTRLPVVVNDVRLEASLAPLLDQLLSDGHRALACFPLITGERAVGVLGLTSADVNAFDDEMVRLLQELAGNIAFALNHLVAEDRLHHLAYYDAISGLANTRLLHERLAQQVPAADARHPLALALMDIERFKGINDSLGRHAGDRLLAQVAARLLETTKDPAHLARLGADHFAIVMTDVRTAADAARLGDEIRRHCFGRAFDVDGHELHLSARFGIAIAPHDGTDAESLFRHAEVALRKAKASGERAVFFDAGMAKAVSEDLVLESKLRRALERGQFVLHYQPKVALSTRRIVGVEALIRWNAPDIGLVPPMKFVPLLEETGLIVEVGRWALEQATRDHRRWQAGGGAAPRIAVNVSAVQLRRPEFVDSVRQVVGPQAGPCGIDIELTESLVMEDIHSTIGKLQALRALGVQVSIDDFGTGYSSLAYLAKLPVQILKIDRAFIRTMLEEANTMMLVSTMVSLAHSLQMEIVAEGVETRAQLEALDRLGCDQIQGFLVSRPVPFETLGNPFNDAFGDAGWVEMAKPA